MICKNCKSEFTPPRKDAVYCSKKCRDSAYKKRKREREGYKVLGLNLVGDRFGMLTAIERTDERDNSFVVYLCKCDCGGLIKVPTGRLRNGTTKSCGCLEDRNRKTLGERAAKINRRHGYWRTRTYKSWISMKSRCNDIKNKDYGGRGIEYDKKWEDFEGFLLDMGCAPVGGSIERINNNLGYFKENCRWATPKDQARNRRTSVFVNYEGNKMTVSEYAEKIGMSWSGARKKAVREGIFLGRMVAGGAFVKDE